MRNIFRNVWHGIVGMLICHTVEWCSKPPKPDDKHILKLEMIVE